MTSTPASCTSHWMLTPVASMQRRAASASSGPTPSPVIKVTSCAITILVPPKTNPAVPSGTDSLPFREGQTFLRFTERQGVHSRQKTINGVKTRQSLPATSKRGRITDNHRSVNAARHAAPTTEAYRCAVPKRLKIAAADTDLYCAAVFHVDCNDAPPRPQILYSAKFAMKSAFASAVPWAIRKPASLFDYLLDRVVRLLNAPLVRQTAGEVARECHAGLWEQVRVRMGEMTPTMARGYVRALAPALVALEVDAVMSRRRVGRYLRPHVVAEAIEQCVAIISDDVRYVAPLRLSRAA